MTGKEVPTTYLRISCKQTQVHRESSLLEKLQTVGLSPAGQKGVNGFTLLFYFSKEPVG